MPKIIQNITNETRRLTIMRPNQTVVKVVKAYTFVTLTDEEFDLYLRPSPPLNPQVWNVVSSVPDVTPPVPVPIPPSQTTDGLPEGIINRYFTEERARFSVVSDSINPLITNMAPSQAAVAQALSSPEFTQVAERTLTPAEVSALSSTPIDLIVAPGTGFSIIVESVELFLDFNSTAYSGAGNIVIEYSMSAPILQFESSGFLSATSDQHRFKVGHTDFEMMLEDNLVRIRSVSPLTQGDSPLTARVRYKRHSVLS